MSRLTPVSLSLVLIASLSIPAFAKTEKEFLSDAIKGDNSEVELGQLAISKGGSESMRSFGHMLVDDHSKHRAEAAAMASKLGLSPPTEMTPDAQKGMAVLQKLTGSKFDSEFSRMMVMDHEKDIAEYKKEAASGNGAVQKFASESLRTLEKHLQTAKSIESGK